MLFRVPDRNFVINPLDSLENLIGGSDLEHAADERHDALLLDDGERRPEDEQLCVGGLGVQLRVGEAVEVGLGEEARHRLREAGLATELWMDGIEEKHFLT